MGKLVILRHGETIFNRDKRMTGTADVPLTDLGIAQAERAGEVLKDISFDKAYSSTLTRAFNTAALALKSSVKNSELPVEKRPEIVERDVGDFTGRYHKKDPEILRLTRNFDTRHPNGESFKDVVERIGQFYEKELKPRLDRGETVMVSCHAGVVLAFKYYLGELTKSQIATARVENAAPWVLEYKKGQIVKSYNIKTQASANSNNKKKPPKMG